MLHALGVNTRMQYSSRTGFHNHLAPWMSIIVCLGRNVQGYATIQYNRNMSGTGRSCFETFSLRLLPWHEWVPAPHLPSTFPAAWRHAQGRDSGQESTRKNGAKTLVACVCEGAIILLVFSQHTPGDRAITTSSVTVPLIPEKIRESSANISTNSDGEPRGKHRQSPRDLALSKKSRVPPPMLSGLSTVLDLAILSGVGSEKSKTTGKVDSVVIALLLTNEAKGGGGSSDGVGNCGNGFNDARETFLRTWRWVLSDGGEGVLRPGRW